MFLLLHKTIQNYFFNTPCAGKLDSSQPHIVEASTGDENQGASLKLYLFVEENSILEARFQAFGDPYVIAAASWLTQFLKNKSLIDAKKIRCKMIIEALEIPDSKKAAAVLAEATLHKAINNYEEIYG